MNKKTKRIVIISAIILIVLIAAFVLIRSLNKPAGIAGAKTITVTVVYADETSKDFTIDTDAEFLRGALEEQNLVQGTESQLGLYITAVDGVAANEANQEWWRLSQNGEDLITGIDETPIADGDSFTLTLTVGW